MRRKFATKALSFVLASVLTVGATITVSAAPATDSSSASSSSNIDMRPIQTKMDGGVVKISRDNGATWSAYTPPASTEKASDGDVDDALEIVKDGIDDLGEMADIPGMNLITDSVFDLVFPNNESDQIADSLNEIETNLDKITADLAEDEQKLSDQQTEDLLKAEVNNFDTNQFSAYHSNVDIMTSELNSIDTVYQNDSADMQTALHDYIIKGVDKSTINGNNILSATIAYGNQLADDGHVLENYTQMMVYANKWEHQGYADRKEYLAKLLQTYTELTMISEMSIAVENETDPILAKADFTTLNKNIQSVQGAIATYQVVERPSNERYYQVPGHECLLSSIAEPRQVNPNLPNGWAGSMDNFHSLLQNNQFQNLFTNQSLGTTNSNPTAQWMQQIFADYNGKMSMFGIFFSPTEGNFTSTKPLGTSVFLTNDEHFDWEQHKDLFGTSWADFTESATMVLNNSNTQLVQLAEGGIGGSNGLEYLDDQHNVNFIGLSVLSQGATSTHFQPSPAQTGAPATVPSSSVSHNTSSVYSNSSNVVDNPHTGASNTNTSLPWALTVITTGGALIAVLLWRKRCIHR